jgi:uncharacterized protein YndB with AHSA1/START domain
MARKRVEVEATIEQPIERVFAYLEDPTRWHLFAPAVKLRRQLGDGPAGVGTRWDAIDRVGPFTVRFIDELVEYEPGHRVVWGSSAPWNARTEYVCTRTGDGTRVRARYEGDVDGWLRLVAWVPAPLVARVLAQDFRRLRDLLTEGPGTAEHGSPPCRTSRSSSCRTSRRPSSAGSDRGG